MISGMPFGLFFFAVALIAGGIAAVTGFAIGSLLTPTLALETEHRRCGELDTGVEDAR